MSRLAFSSKYFIASLLLGAGVIWLVWKCWYPGPLLVLMDAHRLLFLMVAAQALVIPIIVSLVFKPGKTRVWMDVAILASLQLCILVFGIHAMWQGRPVYIADVGDRYDLVAANLVHPKDLQQAGITLPAWGPKWVGTRPPHTSELKDRVVFSALAGKDYGHFPQLHTPPAPTKTPQVPGAQPWSALYDHNTSISETAIARWLTDHRRKESDVFYLPLRGPERDGAVVFDARTGSLLGIAPFNPW
ncbi:MAG: hypothetical protein Q4F13_02100 [Pseudomonadota bacterium]|nr:hypothetical protein [Pseudomonadota bacterium]